MNSRKMRRSHSSKARLGAAVGAVGGLLLSTAAHAYCREVTETPPIGQDPSTSGTCFTIDPEAGAVLPPLFWRNQCVNFNLNRAASPKSSIALNDVRPIATQAFALWNSATCPGTGGSPSILATEGEDVDCNGPSAGHNNPIIFRDNNWTYSDTSNAVGYTTLTVALDTGEILSAQIEINSQDYVIVTTSPPPLDGQYDLQSILLHEAGHFLGLSHATDKTAVMYAFYHAGSTGLQQDDVAGICSIYPSDGSRNTMAGSISGGSCDPKPLYGFEDLCGALDAAPPGEVISSVPYDAGAGPLTENLWGCTMGRTAPRGRVGFVACALAALGMLVRRGRRRAVPAQSATPS